MRVYGPVDKRITATAIADVTPRGTNYRALHLASDWDINLDILADGCSHPIPKTLLISASGRRGIKDLIELLEWFVAVLRDDLSESRMKDEAAGWDVADPA